MRYFRFFGGPSSAEAGILGRDHPVPGAVRILPPEVCAVLWRTGQTQPEPEPEDHGEVLREGDFGDGQVKIEDRLISASLRAYEGAEREQVLGLFHAFCVFPEDDFFLAMISSLEII